MKAAKITTIAMAAILSVAAVAVFSTPTSAYIVDCPDTGVDSEGYYYKRCITSEKNQGFQVSMTCVNFLQIGGLVYGNVAASGQISRVKCGFGTSPLNGNLYYRTVSL